VPRLQVYTRSESLKTQGGIGRGGELYFHRSEKNRYLSNGVYFFFLLIADEKVGSEFF